MLRQVLRARKEYLLRKQIEEKRARIIEKRQMLQSSLATNTPIPTELTKHGYDVRLRTEMDLSNSVAESAVPEEQDEYAGADMPKILITTSRDPSSRLMQFSKELKLVFPNSERVNRGSYVVSDLIGLCRKFAFTDLVMVREHRGRPDALIVSHMPYGPTAYFSLTDVCLRHDLEQKPAQMKLAAPHLVFHGFSGSKLGKRLQRIISHLFPAAASKTCSRVLTFATGVSSGDEDEDRVDGVTGETDDIIHFRNHEVGLEMGERDDGVALGDKDEQFNKFSSKSSGSKAVGSSSASGSKAGSSSASGASSSSLKKKEKNPYFAKQDPSNISLVEVGPRFSMRCYKIELGTPDMPAVKCEWTYRPYFNSQKSLFAEREGDNEEEDKSASKSSGPEKSAKGKGLSSRGKSSGKSSSRSKGPKKDLKKGAAVKHRAKKARSKAVKESKSKKV